MKFKDSDGKDLYDEMLEAMKKIKEDFAKAKWYKTNISIAQAL